MGVNLSHDLSVSERVTTQDRKLELYRALLAKDKDYEGVFFVGVKTTGVFCRPTCPARKPKFENCEFFTSVQAALLASFRPCKRCQPLSHPSQVSGVVKRLVDAVEADPAKRWQDADFRALSVDASTARRRFKKRFGMTFVAYARARRIGLAVEHIRAGSVIDAQLEAGYESDSGFRDAFSRTMGAAPTKAHGTVLKAAWLDTPLGPMLVIAGEEVLYLLEFVNRRGLEREVEQLRERMRAAIVPGRSEPVERVEEELGRYFAGELKRFSVPTADLGTPFQKRVWHILKDIPAGETRSYAQIAEAMGKPSAYRAVARANGANQLALVIPCHRVINSDGSLGGYGGGLPRKEWLLGHERSMI